MLAISEINSNGHRLLNIDPIIDSFFQDSQDLLIVGQDFFQKECANKNVSPSVRKLQPRKTYNKLHFVFPYMNPKVRGYDLIVKICFIMLVVCIKKFGCFFLLID